MTTEQYNNRRDETDERDDKDATVFVAIAASGVVLAWVWFLAKMVISI